MEHTRSRVSLYRLFWPTNQLLGFSNLDFLQFSYESFGKKGQIVTEESKKISLFYESFQKQIDEHVVKSVFCTLLKFFPEFDLDQTTVIKWTRSNDEIRGFYERRSTRNS